MNIRLSSFKRPSNRYNLFYRFLWNCVQLILFRLSPRIFWVWRIFLLKVFGAKIGKGVKLDPTATFYDPRNIEIGNYVWIGPMDELYSLDKITIGNNVALAQHVKLYTVSHDITDPYFPTISSPITIKDQVWLAADTFVGMGVTIGEGAVLGARSSAFKDLPSWQVCVGTPAKPMYKRVLKAQDHQ